VRYRLRTLFLLTFLVAVACAVLFAVPAVVSLIVLSAVAMVTPAGLVAGVIYGRRAKRAFAIGCLASGGWALWASPIYVVAAASEGFDLSDQSMVVQVMFVSFYAVMALGGGVSVGVRRLCYQGRNGIRPPRDCC
jgi:uncharacterized membrane protein YhaH (DUF805 family)